MSKTFILLVSMVFFSLIGIDCKAQEYTGNPNDSIVGCQSGEVTYGYRSTACSLILLGNIGAGLIRSELTPSISYNLLVENSKGHAFGISGSNYYLFNRQKGSPFSVHNNHFIGPAYYKSYDDSEKNDFGLSLGYLLNDSRKDFEGETFMLSFHRSMKNFTISPSLILSNNFKTVYPSVTIGFNVF